MKKTAVLLIGFGGPRSLEEVRPFLASVTGGTNIPEARIQEVYHHYELIGGKSKFNEVTELQRTALEKELRARGQDLSVGAAYRHSTPSFKDAFEQFKRFGVERVICVVLSSFRSFASRGKYLEHIKQAAGQAQAASIEVVYTSPFELDPSYIGAQTDRVREIWNLFSDARKKQTRVFFTAHSIPSAMDDKSAAENGGMSYSAQFEQASGRIGGFLGLPRWEVCYQSRSGSPKEPWLGPDISEVITKLHPDAGKGVLLVPVGFLCDNVEVVYDLDHEAKKAAEGRGLDYRRAGTVGDHPKFIKMLADKIMEKV